MSGTNVQHTCVFGLSWGDEGKGKVVDLLGPAFDVVVRFNGGANAGHTVRVGDEQFAMHLLPTGLLRKNVTGVIGPGVVADPLQLIKEIDGLKARGIDVAPKLKISNRAHLVLPYHKLEDTLSEESQTSKTRLGTTARGIGPCYADKMRRSSAVRFADLVEDADLDARVRSIASLRSTLFKELYGTDGDLDVEGIIRDLSVARDRLAPLVCDTTRYLHEVIEAGRPVLFEGANGLLLDVDHGTYPFVTSSSTGPHGIGAGAGVPPGLVTQIVGTTKAYATRVGSGPFMTELKGADGDRIREAGHEYGTTTGRPRRCGWFDAVACREAVRLTGVTDIAMMHLDTLSGFDEVGVCIGYRLDGKTMMTPPAHTLALQKIEPVIEMFPGWHENLRDIRRFEDLPKTARDYVHTIESLVGAPLSLIGVGPDRAQTLVRGALRQVIETPAASAF